MTITDEELSRLRMKWMIQSDERGLGGIELLDEVRDLRAENEDLRSADRLAVHLLQIADTCVGKLKAERTSLRTALRDVLTKARAHEAIGSAGTDYPIDIAAAIGQIAAERDLLKVEVQQLRDCLRVSEEQNDALGDANVLAVEIERTREIAAQRLVQADHFLAQRVALEAEVERLAAACESMVVECGQVQIKLEEAQAEIATARDLQVIGDLQREVRESRPKIDKLQATLLEALTGWSEVAAEVPGSESWNWDRIAELGDLGRGEP